MLSEVAERVGAFNLACREEDQGVKMKDAGSCEMRQQEEDDINKLCRHCVRGCKQPSCIVMLDCPRFQPRPFKSEQHKFQQMDLF